MKIKILGTVVMFFLFILPLTISAQSIFEAARTGDLAKVKELTEANKNLVNRKDSRGRSPLFYAISGKNEGVVKYLLENGADAALVVKHSGSLLDIALATEQQQIAAMLEARGAKTTQVTYTVKDLTEKIRHFSFTSGMLNNIIVFDGNNGLLIFDTGYNKASVEVLKKYLADNYKNNVSYIFNTHTHGDHIAGNKEFGVDQNHIIFSSMLQKNYDQIGAVKNSAPLTGRNGKSFNSYYTMKLNGEEIRLIPYPGVHSDEDLIFYFVNSKVVFAGDLLLSQCFPAVSSPKAYSKFLDEVIDIFPEDVTFISGHGKPITYNELKDYHMLLKKTAFIIKTNMDKGKSLETMLKEDILSNYRKEYSFLDFLSPDSWIRIVYNEQK